jgi:TRAP-type C4-dicarboxylate transport system permease small subunit
MEKLIKSLDSHYEIFRKFIDILIIVLFTILILVVFSQVVFRYVFNNSLTWAEEMARYLQVWIVLLAAAAAVRTGSHISVDYATHNLSSRYKNFLNIIITFLTILFLCIVTVYGFKLFIQIYHSTQRSPAMQMPMFVAYVAIPIGGFFMLIEAIIVFLKLIINQRV